MKGQMKRLFAVLLTVLLITDSQSAACSSLASFAMGARCVQASELSAESTADVSAVPGEIDGFAPLGDMAHADTSYFDAEGGAGEEFSADSSFGGEINDDASLFGAASADPESSGESALGAASGDTEIFGGAAPDAELFVDGAPDAEDFSVTSEAANGGLDEWNPDAGFETDPAQGSLDQEAAADAGQAAVEENADSVFEDAGEDTAFDETVQNDD